MPVTRDTLTPAIQQWAARVLDDSAETVARDTRADEWLHDEPPAPFDPHIALHGVTFDSPTDEQLQNLGTFPRVPFFTPGDHRGCRCTFDPVVVRARSVGPLHVRLEAPTRSPKVAVVRRRSVTLYIPRRVTGQSPRWWEKSLRDRWPDALRRAARTVTL